MPGITKALIAKELRESVFSPKNDFPFTVISEVGDYDYFIRKAKEILLSIPISRFENKELVLAELKTIISLLALAKVELKYGKENNKAT
ncbi:MAG: hypothetical protein WC942_03720 [Clostridia bacterium]|jgi:hypothetical protein